MSSCSTHAGTLWHRSCAICGPPRGPCMHMPTTAAAHRWRSLRSRSARLAAACSAFFRPSAIAAAGTLPCCRGKREGWFGGAPVKC